MPSDEVSPLSPGAAPKRPGLVHRHSSTSSHVSHSPAKSHSGTRPGHHQPHTHKHVVGHGRTGRNPSFHRTLSKIKIPPVPAVVDDDGPPTPKAKQHQRTVSSGAITPQLPQLPGSLALPSPGLRPGMKRNNTSLALPRVGNQAALKKNLSSGQLNRLGASRTVTSHHAHKSSRQERPDVRKAVAQAHKRHKSPAPEVRQPETTVHWTAGSDEDDDGQEMEGVDDVWTEESASASPNTTRDNTRDNTRQNSVILDASENPYSHTAQAGVPSDGTPRDNLSDTVEGTSPRSQLPSSTTFTRDFATQELAQKASYHQAQQLQKEAEADEDEDQDNDKDDEDPDEDEEDEDDDDDDNDEEDEEEEEDEEDDNEDDDEDDDITPMEQQRRQQEYKKQHNQHQPSQLHQHHHAQQHHQHQQQHQQQPRPLDTELIAKRLLEKNSPAPPRVSSISALANAASADPKSLSQTQNGNLAPTGANNTPVVSRFVGPDDGIGSKDATPQTQSGFLRSHSRQSSVSQQHLQSQDGGLLRNKSAPNFALTPNDRGVRSPTTPSGAQAPDTLLNNSRTQQKLWLQRGLSNIEASSQPHLPGLLPTGRAQAMRTPSKGMQFEFVDKEYAVVRRFHNTLLQGIERIRVAHGGTLPNKPKKSPHPPQTLGVAANGHTSKIPSTAQDTRSARNTGAMAGRSHRESAGQRARVSFHTGASPESGRQSPVDDDDEDEHVVNDDVDRPLSAAEIARRMWESDVMPVSVEG